MKNTILSFVATLCIASISSAAVASNCDPTNPIDEVTALALNMYHEARGDGKTHIEKLEAMQMVGEVTLNRVRSNNYPDSICEVVYQKSQFSWTGQNKKTPKEIEIWMESVELAESLLDGSASYFYTNATHFLNPSAVNKMPGWTKRLDTVGKVGNHIFYTDYSVHITDMLPSSGAI